MKKNRKNNKRIKLDADLDKELDNYVVESSDDGLDTNDRILLKNARGRKIREEEEEVFPVKVDSDSDSDDDNVDYENQEENDDIDEELSPNDISENESDNIEMDSDIESKSDDGLPDSKAWGSKRKDYYNTDYVDKDFSGFDNEEEAVLEEQEAKSIQERLLRQLEDSDFTMGLLDKVKEKKEQNLKGGSKSKNEEKIKMDLSKLTQQELEEHQDVLIPGFSQYKQYYKEYELFSNTYIKPMFTYAKENNQFNHPDLDTLKEKYSLILRYMVFFNFLLMLKQKNYPNIGKHPVLKYLTEIPRRINEIDNLKNMNLNKKILLLIDFLSNMRNNNLKETAEAFTRSFKMRKGYLKTSEDMKDFLNKLRGAREMFRIEQIEENRERKVKFADEIEDVELSLLTVSRKLETNKNKNIRKEESEDEINNQINTEGGDEKRAITYQMLKNKGLTPKRKKEVKNPRVKNKNKYKKALVRRKGQVKLARHEIKKYDGEISGIRKNLSRSIKLK